MEQISTKRGLSVALSRLRGFDSPNVRLEQYATDPDVAASLLWTAYMRGDLEGAKIADFGSGTGILGIGALLLGAAEVIFVESEDSAMQTAKKNLDWARKHFAFEGNARFIEGDITSFHEEVDVIVENPPFGTKISHADRLFLSQAVALSPTIYSLHKSTSKSFIEAFARDHGYRVLVLENYDYPLFSTMEHHTARKKIIQVSLFLLKK